MVAGVLIDRGRRVLIAQRPAGKHLAGSWEFPGGKLEPGEPRAAGLARELREELGIEIREPRPLIRLRHRYPYGDVLLDVWVVRRYHGRPQSLDGQALRWVSPQALALAAAKAELLPADRPIVAALGLPERLRLASHARYTVCGRRGLRERRDSPERADSRERGDAPERRDSPERGDARERRGSSERPDSYERRDSQDRGPKLLGVLCSTADEAEEAAVAGGADFLVMRRPLAERELGVLCERTSVPVYARAVTLERAWALGASGVNSLRLR